MKIIIFGGGRVGRTLVQILSAKKYDITLVDSSKEVCDYLASEYNINVVCEDATDPNLLDELKLNTADFVFAVTGNEEINFLVSVYAKHSNAKRVISRGSEAKYSKLMERLGVEPLIPELTLARDLANAVMTPVISLMLDPTYSHIELIEQDVNGNLVNKKVREVNKKKNFTVVSLFQDNKFISPEPDTPLKKGMKIVVIKHGE